uniref:BTB domain-containing protein n=1 Tax=Steinernema glaseri TaxID=37863 RepID=A0A1I8AVE7_9BILA
MASSVSISPAILLTASSFRVSVNETATLMGTEVAHPSSSTQDRPFKLLVKEDIFTVDSEALRRLSPIFALMCFGKDFDNGRELAREIVDEKSVDISTFLGCLEDHKKITEFNFSTILRLAEKYQVESLTSACESFICDRLDLDNVKPDQVLTLLIAANEYHLKRETINALIVRLSKEERVVFTRLKLSRYLPSNIYGAILATSLNIAQAKEIATMNGHLFKMERNKTQYKRAVCGMCKKIVDGAASCDGCRMVLCATHWKTNACMNSYGKQMLEELKSNIVELEYVD